MAQLVVWDILSLDGYFEGDQPWDLRLHEHLWGEDLRQLSLQIGEEAELLVFGRRTYEGMASHWPQDATEPEIARYMNAMPKLVASRTITSSSWNNTVVTADIMTELRQRKAAANGPIYVFGSAELVDGLLEAGLVDELLLGIAPVVLGSGNPFFKAAHRQRDLILLETHVADTGGVILRYAVS